MERSVPSETTFFIMKLQPEICPQLRTTGAEAHALILVGCRVLTPQRSTTPRFACFFL